MAAISGLAQLAAILGQSALGIPQGIDAAERMRMSEEDRALKQQTLAETVRQHQETTGLAKQRLAADEAGRYVTLPDGTKMDRGLGTQLYGDQLKRQAQQRAEDLQRAQRAEQAGAVADIGATEGAPEFLGPPGGPMEPLTLTRKPEMEQMGRVVRSGGMEALGKLVPLLKRDDAKLQGFAADHDIYEMPTGGGTPRLVRPGTPKVKPERTLAERYAAAQQAFNVTPSPEALATLTQAELAYKHQLRLETGKRGAQIDAQLDAPLTPTDAAAVGVDYGTTGRQAFGKKALTAGQRTKMDAQSAVLAMIDNMERKLGNFNHPKDPLGRGMAIPERIYKVYGQADPALTAAHRQIEGTLALIVRALGEVGTLTDKDIERARVLQPMLAPIPDTEAVIAEKLNGLRELVTEVATRTGMRPDGVTVGPAAQQIASPQPQATTAQQGVQRGAPSGSGVIRWGRDAKGRPVRLP